MIVGADRLGLVSVSTAAASSRSMQRGCSTPEAVTTPVLLLVDQTGTLIGTRVASLLLSGLAAAASHVDSVKPATCRLQVAGF